MNKKYISLLFTLVLLTSCGSKTQTQQQVDSIVNDTPVIAEWAAALNPESTTTKAVELAPHAEWVVKTPSNNNEANQGASEEETSSDIAPGSQLETEDFPTPEIIDAPPAESEAAENEPASTGEDSEPVANETPTSEPAPTQENDVVTEEASPEDSWSGSEDTQTE